MHLFRHHLIYLLKVIETLYDHIRWLHRYINLADDAATFDALTPVFDFLMMATMLTALSDLISYSA